MSPVYEYKCPQCNMTAELRKSYSDVSFRPQCLDCGHIMNRVYSTPEISVKKNRPHGFYPPERLEVKE